MPITQDRFINVIRGAKRVMQINRQVKDAAWRDMPTDMTIVNSFIARTTDPQAKEVVSLLLNRINRISQIFLELTDADTEEFFGLIIAEEHHFNKFARRNEKSAYYRKQNRREQHIPPKSPELAIPAPPTRTEELTEKSTANDPGLERFKKDMAPIHATWNSHAEELIEVQKTYGDVSLDAAAARELEAIRQSQSPMPEPLAISPHQQTMPVPLTDAKPKLRPYRSRDKERADVVATSVPELDDLNRPPIEIGKDVF